MNTEKNYDSSTVRKGCRDIWNAFMVKGATFTEHDIPYCPTTAKSIPENIITYDEARSIYKKELEHKNKEFKNSAFVCFYTDDYKFDSTCGIWFGYKTAFRILQHFAGIITPDFSTYQDFPEPLKIYNTYRMRAFGYCYGRQGGEVINNVRWGTPETYDYCFAGIPQNSVVAIGTVGGSPRKLLNRKRFEDGLDEMIKRLSPKLIIVYGSANYHCFEKLKEQGISIINFPSKTAKAFERRKTNE